MNYVVARIVFAWNSQLCKVSLVACSEQQITSKVEDAHSIYFVVTMVYGHNRATDRRILRTELRNLHGDIGSGSGSAAWNFWGDFNAVRRSSERSDPECFDVVVADDFNSCIGDIGVEDLNAKGFFFTWSSRSGDRAMVES